MLGQPRQHDLAGHGHAEPGPAQFLHDGVVEVVGGSNHDVHYRSAFSGISQDLE
jgi:hypothetical protein